MKRLHRPISRGGAPGWGLYAADGRRLPLAVTSSSPPSSLHMPDCSGRVQQQGGALRDQYPGLVSRLQAALEDADPGGIDLVVRATDLALGSLPQSSPWSRPAVLDPARLCDTRGAWCDQGL